MADGETAPVGRGRRAVVVGCGPAGALMSIYLARQGWKVETYELRTIYDKSGPDGGIITRGYDIFLSPRGLDAIRRAGADLGPESAVYVDSVMIHSDKVGKCSKLPLDMETAMVNRNVLGETLRKEGMHMFPDQISYHHGHKLVDVDLEGKLVSFKKGSSSVTRPYDFLVGCDGVWSSVRAAMERKGFLASKQKKNVGVGWWAELGRIEDMPGAEPSWSRGWHLWLKQSKHAIMAASPTPEGGCRLIVGTDALDKVPLSKGSDAEVEAEAWLRSTFPDFFGDRDLPEGWVKSLLEQEPIGNGVETLCTAFHGGHSVVLIGDAAHSVFPNQGQGCSAALESCTILADLIVEHGGNLATALPMFTSARKPEVDALAVMSRRPFINVPLLLRYSVLMALHKTLPFLFDEPSENKIGRTEVNYRKIEKLHKWQSFQLVFLSLGAVGLTFLGLRRR